MNGTTPGGGIGAGELALLQNSGNNWNDNPFAYLIWLIALRGGGMFGGGGAEAAAVTSQADAIRGIAEAVNAGSLGFT